MKTLREVYESNSANLDKLYDELQEKGLYDTCSYPLLLSGWEGEALPDVMFFGQETNGWGHHNTIDGLMEDYRDFNLGENYNSLFWQYLWKMSSILGLTGNHPFLWNNINKIGCVDSVGRPDPIVTELENKYFNVLKDELEVVKPKICIFFTGPNYDADLRAKLPDLEILPVEGYAVNEVARLKSRYLPAHSFRTYHPGYGNRYPDWYKKVLNLSISEKCKEIINHYLESLSVSKSFRVFRKDLFFKLQDLAYAIIEDNYAEIKHLPFVEKKEVKFSYSSSSNSEPFKTRMEDMRNSLQHLSYELNRQANQMTAMAINRKLLQKKQPHECGTILERISSDDLVFLKKHPIQSLEVIQSVSIKKLYGSLFTDGELVLLKLLAEIDNKSIIECFNCDAGVLHELGSVSQVRYNEKELTDLENELFSMAFSKNIDATKKVYFFQEECKKYKFHQSHLPQLKNINWEHFYDFVKKLKENESAVILVKRITLYQNLDSDFKKYLISSGKLRAVFDLTGNEYNSSRDKNSVIIITGRRNSNVMMINNSNKISLMNLYFKDTEEAPFSLDPFSKICSINNQTDFKIIPISNLKYPYVLAPVFYSRYHGETMRELRDIATLIGPNNPNERIKESERCKNIVFNKENFSSLPPIEPTKYDTLNDNQINGDYQIWDIKNDNTIIVTVKDDVVYVSYLENTRNCRLLVNLKWNRYLILGIDNNNRVFTQFLAHMFLSEGWGIKEQLLSLFGKRGNNLMNVGKILIPIFAQSEQFKYVLENINRRFRSEIRNITREKNNYREMIRSRKHSIGNEIYAFRGSWGRLKNELINRDGKELDLNEEIGKTFVTTPKKLIEKVTGDIDNIAELVEHIADRDENDGDPIVINLNQYMSEYVETKDFNDIRIIFVNSFVDSELDTYISFPLKSLNKILTNIFCNINQHGFVRGFDRDKKIRISILTKGDSIILNISNNGAPLSDKIDIFNRYDKVRLRGGHISEGLGLEDCRNLMNKFGGKLQLFPEEMEFRTTYELTFKRGSYEK